MINFVILISFRPETEKKISFNPILYGFISGNVVKFSFYLLGILLTLFSFIVIRQFIYKRFIFDIKEEFKSTSSRNFGRFWGFIKYCLWNYIKILGNQDSMYYAAYFLFSLLGIFIHPFFFTLLLLMIIKKFESLNNVIAAITGPLREICMTLFLFLIIEYVFTVIAYTWFSNTYPDQTCDNLTSCFLITLDQTFKQNGGVGAFLNKTYVISKDGDVSFDYGRLIFDILFNFSILLLTVQILSGLIINKFGALRDDAEKTREDLTTNCIMCGENIEVIERKTGKSFDHHINQVHCCWDYMLLIGYLSKKPELEHTGIESYVYSKITKKDHRWLPYFAYKK